MTPVPQMTQFDAAANLALFLLERTGSVFGEFDGRLPAAQQRAIFGRFLGKGLVTINGATETLQHTIKVGFGFGFDYDVTFDKPWSALRA